MDLQTFVVGFGAFTIFVFLFCGIDDAIWDIVSFCSRIYRRKSNNARINFEQMRSTPPKMLAVCIAAWHESNVIEDVIDTFVTNTDYPKSMYHLFVGVYPNDPETIAAVKSASKRFPNVHAIVNCIDGPTTKAQNINHVIRQIKLYEERNHIRFASLTVHDSEDVIHSYELLATNYLIDKHEALQFPVFPIMEMPTFKNFFRQLTTGTYADEFAEHHFTTLVARRNLGAFVPCAGTGFALSRGLIDRFNGEDVLPSDSLTEDYLLSLQLYKKGISLHYVLERLPRVLPNGKIKDDFITTRALFPATFHAAVRQKTRWAYGITMQSISLRDVFFSKGVSFAGRYSFYKDVKSKYINLMPIIGYAASLYCIVSFPFGLPKMFPEDSPFFFLAVLVFLMMFVRQVTRAHSLYRVYGLKSAFFGCFLPPLLPIRLIYGNIINFAATKGAISMRFRVGKNRPQKEKAKKSPRRKVKWAKTDHEFLTSEQLQRYRRKLGDTLIVQGCLTAEEFRDALEEMDHESGEHIGAFLIRKGLITEVQMVQALSHVQHVLFLPDGVVSKLGYRGALEQFDRERLRKAKILPLAVESDTVYVAVCDETSDAAIRVFSEENGVNVKRMYAMESQIISALSDERNPDRTLDSIGLYRAGVLSYEQAVLVGVYSVFLKKPEREIQAYMGLPAGADAKTAHRYGLRRVHHAQAPQLKQHIR